MKASSAVTSVFAWMVIAFAVCGPTRAASVNESAREIPVAYEVDVLVVGGSTGAVAAAVAAAQSGADVFLAAPRPYLGDDMTATLQLWLEEGEQPTTDLARQIYSDEAEMQYGSDPNAMPFSYQTDIPSSGQHRDSNPPGKLSDGIWGDATRQSVQFDESVEITADLGARKEVAEVRLFAYYRAGEANFKVERVIFSTSDDGESWQQAAEVEFRGSEECGPLSAPIGAPTRYVKLNVVKPDNVSRILLGEIEIVAPAAEKPTGPKEFVTPRPMHVKKTLDDALLAAGVKFLYGCYPTDVLRDGSGNPCGIVMANRAGRQAVVAKVIVDATDRATVARLAGAEVSPFPGGVQTFKRVVIGGEILAGENMTARVIDPPFRGGPGGKEYQIIEYTLEIPVAEDTPACWAAADQLARSMTYHPEQQFTSDALFQVPPDAVSADASASQEAPRNVIRELLRPFRPRGVRGVYVLGGCVDVPREQAAKLLRPVMLMATGSFLGKAIGEMVHGQDPPGGVHVPGEMAKNPAATGDVGELLVGVRPVQELDTVPQQARSLPVLGRYDVVVIGGGTGGAPAGIGAARYGAKTLVVEYLQGLGGVGTTGAIAGYYWGNRVGFTATVGGGTRWIIEEKKEWYRSELLTAGADIWFGTLGCGAFVDQGQVKGAVVVTPQGRGVVLADVVIDSTGNADVAVAAGSKYRYTDHTELAMQGTGLPPRDLGAKYKNTDFTIADETDVVDIWHLFVYSKDKYAEAFDQGRLVDTRERRRIVGDFTMNILDQVLERTYPDTIEVAYSNFDTHGYTIAPYLELEHPGKQGYYISLPYRCLLPTGLKGILVCGLAVSAHRDAVPMIRMQPDIQNQGYAAGRAAAMCVADGVDLRDVDIRALQNHLIEIGNIPESVLTDQDSFPLPAERIAAAVESITDGFSGVAVLLAQPDLARPLLQEAYARAEGDDKLVYAHVLAVLGDDTGVETLIAAVRGADAWDEGWNYVGMGQFGRALSPLDQLIVALGRAGDRKAVPVIVEKLKTLTAEDEFSHHRAVALALELLGDSQAAKPLAGLLTQPGMAGHVHYTIEDAREKDQASDGGTNAVQTRRESLRELSLARALYHCGDYGNVGTQILTKYTEDLRGHFSRHAKAVLDTPK